MRNKLIKDDYKLLLDTPTVHIYYKWFDNLKVEIIIEDETEECAEDIRCHIDDNQGISLGDLTVNNYDECKKFIKFVSELIKNRNAEIH